MPVRCLLALLVLLSSAAQAQTQIALTPSRDTVLFESPAELSSGQGPHLFCGRLLTGERRRSLLAFDFSAIPPGSTILDVTLTLYLSKTLSGPVTVSLHRAIGNWGEAGSDSGSGGMGDSARMGDASWRYRVFDQDFWSTEGGDFAAQASAQTLVSGLIGPYDWSDPDLARDVQDWIDSPAGNDGWMLIGAENSGNQTAMRFESRENFAMTRRPTLTVSYRGAPAGGPPPQLPPSAVPGLGLPGLSLLIALTLLLGLRRRVG